MEERDFGSRGSPGNRIGRSGFGRGRGVRCAKHHRGNV